MYFNAEAAWQALDSDFSMLSEMPSDYSRELTAAWWDYMTAKLGYLMKSAPDPDGVYNKASFNEAGDIIYPRSGNIMPLKYDPNRKVSLNGEIWDDEFIGYLNDYIDYAESKGATVYFSFCPVNKLALADGTIMKHSWQLCFSGGNLTCGHSAPSEYILRRDFTNITFILTILGVAVRTSACRGFKLDAGSLEAVDIELMSCQTIDRNRGGRNE